MGTKKSKKASATRRIAEAEAQKAETEARARAEAEAETARIEAEAAAAAARAKAEAEAKAKAEEEAEVARAKAKADAEAESAALAAARIASVRANASDNTDTSSGSDSDSDSDDSNSDSASNSSSVSYSDSDSNSDSDSDSDPDSAFPDTAAVPTIVESDSESKCETETESEFEIELDEPVAVAPNVSPIVDVNVKFSAIAESSVDAKNLENNKNNSNTTSEDDDSFDTDTQSSINSGVDVGSVSDTSSNSDLDTSDSNSNDDSAHIDSIKVTHSTLPGKQENNSKHQTTLSLNTSVFLEDTLDPTAEWASVSTSADILKAATPTTPASASTQLESATNTSLLKVPSLHAAIFADSDDPDTVSTNSRKAYDSQVSTLQLGSRLSSVDLATVTVQQANDEQLKEAILAADTAQIVVQIGLNSEDSDENDEDYISYDSDEDSDNSDEDEDGTDKDDNDTDKDDDRNQTNAKILTEKPHSDAKSLSSGSELSSDGNGKEDGKDDSNDKQSDSAKKGHNVRVETNAIPAIIEASAALESSSIDQVDSETSSISALNKSNKDQFVPDSETVAGVVEIKPVEISLMPDNNLRESAVGQDRNYKHETSGDNRETSKSQSNFVLPILDAHTWISVLFLLSDEKDIIFLASLCKALHKLILDPSVISSWLLRRSTHYLALYNTYKNFPHLLTPTVAQTLISQGAHIPRHLTSLIALENPDIINQTENKPSTKLSDALELLMWTGKTTYGDMFGFDAETAVNATLVPGQEAPEVINAKILQYRRVLGWAYDLVVDERLADAPAVEDRKEEKKRRRRCMKGVTDADAFLQLLKLYRATFEEKEVVVLEPNARGPTGFMAREKKINMMKDANLSEQEKRRNKIAAALRELSNIYRFAPGLVAEKLESGWLPVDLFERDVELAWFLLRHAGEAKSRVVFDSDGYDEVTYR
ncbi:hypothetical protein HK100_000571, partial [Physocladia obscura]